MDKLPVVTVIVPVYNVSAYIVKCARSIFEQTIENLEILFGDDCSPDNSVVIIINTLNNYKNRHSLTRIIRMSTHTRPGGGGGEGLNETKRPNNIDLFGHDWGELYY